MLRTYDFATIGFRPFTETAEFVTIGVVALDVVARHFDFMLQDARKTGRVQGMFPNAGKTLFREVRAGLEKELASIRAAVNGQGPGADVPVFPAFRATDSGLFAAITSPREGVFCSPLGIPHSPLPTPHSPLPTPHSPLPTPHSPLPTRHSPLATRHSSKTNPCYRRARRTRSTAPRRSFPKDRRPRQRIALPMKTTAMIVWLATLAISAAANLAELPHPRLWLPQSGEARLRQNLAADPLAAKLQAASLAEAGRVLTSRTCRYEIPDGKRLLGESRLALHHIMHTAWAWRTGGDEKFRLRAIAELDAACALKDWNPSHFLDVAEMATAVATGYDWLHATLTPDQRSRYEQALIHKALLPAKAVFDKGGWWAKPGNNWSQVCGAGIALAAAAIAGNDDGLAEDLFSRGLKLVEQCGRFYQPDGMYPEGPGYWQYGTNFHVMLLATCAPLGRTTPLDPILQQAGASIMHLTSPTRLSYNFADGGSGRATPSAAQCWLAQQYRDATQAAHVRNLFTRALADDKGRVGGDRYFPLAIVWLPAPPPAATPLPNAAVFHGEQPMALFRTGWEPTAAFLAVKGGTAAASHGHMDVGSFVFDAHGQRWFHDLGAENYNLPGYFGNKRWTYYRLQNRSHNTLEIDGKLQNARSKPCPLTTSSLTGKSLSATFDLTDAYAGAAAKVTRTARFDREQGTARLEDEITAPAGDIRWRAFTDAKVEIRGEQVILSNKDRRISLHRLSKTGTWSVIEAKPPTPEENQNRGYRAVVLTVPAAERVAIAVEIRP